MNNGKQQRVINSVWGDLFNKRNQKKQSRYSNLIESDYDKFFTPVGSGEGLDTITGDEIPANRFIRIGDMILKDVTAQQITLGRQLRDARFMVVSEEPISYWSSCIQPAGLGFFYYFITEQQLKDNELKLRASADHINIVTFNGDNGNCDFLKNIRGINNIYSLEFYGGNENGINRTVPTFEEMCRDNENSSTFSRMGVYCKWMSTTWGIYFSLELVRSVPLCRVWQL